MERSDSRQSSSPLPLSGIDEGAPVILHLHSPREKIWGLLLALNAPGIQIRGIDLNSFDDLILGAGKEQQDRGSGPSLSTFFVPMSRVEKVFLDEPAGPLPSYEERFLKSIGCTLMEYIRRRNQQQ